MPLSETDEAPKSLTGKVPISSLSTKTAKPSFTKTRDADSQQEKKLLAEIARVQINSSTPQQVETINNSRSKNVAQTVAPLQGDEESAELAPTVDKTVALETGDRIKTMLANSEVQDVASDDDASD